jgi:hypothetical protein
MHLRFDALFQLHLAALQNLLDVRPQLPRLRIDDLEFFFDAEGEDVVFRAHTDTATSLKIAARKSPAILALNLLR